MTSSTGAKLGAILVVEDDDTVARAIARLIPDTFTIVLVSSIAGAVRALDQDHDFVAATVDLGLPDGSGFDVVRHLRDESADLPVVVVTGSLTREMINEATALGAQYVCKPDFQPNLEAFFESLPKRGSPEKWTSREAALRYSLTSREQEILYLSLTGVPRGRLAEVMKISENTLKKYVRTLLRKLKQPSLTEAAWFVRSTLGPETDNTGDPGTSDDGDGGEGSGGQSSGGPASRNGSTGDETAGIRSSDISHGLSRSKTTQA